MPRCITFIGVRGGFEILPRPWTVIFAQAGYEDHRYEADYPLFFVHRHWIAQTAMRWSF